MRNGFAAAARFALFATASAVLACGVSGCVVTSAGLPASGFVSPAIARAYLALEGPAYIVLEARGAATVIAPGIAATNAHNANIVDHGRIIGVSRAYDLLFFRTARRAAPPWAEPYPGEEVIAYGQGVDGELRMAEGKVRFTDAEVYPRCRNCGVQHAFVFEADGGEGFSGGPVADAKTGKLVGITFGFRDGLDDCSPDQRLMYAYDMKRVAEERAAAPKFTRLPPPAPPAPEPRCG